MASRKQSKPSAHSLDDRFVFVGDAVAPGDQAALKPALYEVEDRATGAPRCLKLWRKIGTVHGKIIAWDDDDVILTSLNWASAATDPDFPWGDIGVHIHASGIAAYVVARLEWLFPELTDGARAEQSRD